MGLLRAWLMLFAGHMFAFVTGLSIGVKPSMVEAYPYIHAVWFVTYTGTILGILFYRYLKSRKK